MNQTTKKKDWRTLAIDKNNLDWLKAFAAKLSEETGVRHSINDVISVLRKPKTNE